MAGNGPNVDEERLLFVLYFHINDRKDDRSSCDRFSDFAYDYIKRLRRYGKIYINGFPCSSLYQQSFCSH